jgi:2-succinyl-6-hydroxy-2,4-cyclohexadiene-1-carboxylate synthase
VAQPLVLLHGFAGAPASWQRVVALLGDARDLVCPALLGHDPARLDDELADPPGSFDEAVDRLAADLRQRGVTGDAHVCGYSLGGRMALGLLVRHRALFRRATLIGVNPGLEADRDARAAGDERWAVAAERGLDAFLAAWEAQPLFATQRRLPAEVQGEQRRWRGELRGAGLALSLRVVGLAAMPDYWPALPGLDLPVDLVAGELDAKFRQLAERARARLPDAHLSVVPGCGHNVPLESPAAVAQIVIAGPGELTRE